MIFKVPYSTVDKSQEAIKHTRIVPFDPRSINTRLEMDSLSVNTEIADGLKNMSARDKQELNQFVVGEQQKAQIQSSEAFLIDTIASCLLTTL